MRREEEQAPRGLQQAGRAAPPTPLQHCLSHAGGEGGGRRRGAGDVPLGLPASRGFRGALPFLHVDHGDHDEPLPEREARRRPCPHDGAGDRSAGGSSRTNRPGHRSCREGPTVAAPLSHAPPPNGRGFVGVIVAGIIRVVPEATRPFPAGDARIAGEVSRPKREEKDRFRRSEAGSWMPGAVPRRPPIS